ncbi:hypothetical protein K378_03208 [Streptomyces sp. Amel2xB2]|uniref:hypothetical protein n=1 Tax=Streptomyces sp. Amel2xB2 TaxID=1305829 RepID=UPI000DBA8F28|nr:hypothetical protein [Streptomyces sp. Amel2xB2]RAJ65590.1 hypothetical protein K378_03208 [Streptomyces sp. Amel2xB2]
MDPVSASAITAAVGAAASSAGTEAGRHAWESLVALCRRIGGGRSNNGDEIALPDDPDDEQQVRDLTARVIEESGRDETFAADLESWAGRHGFTLRAEQDTVHNTVSGEARISGNVIQGRDFSGPINLG